MHIENRQVNPENDVILAYLADAQPRIRDSINNFCEEHFVCLGGREGSGMGGVLEALYLFHANSTLHEAGAPPYAGLAWISDHRYNDFACLDTRLQWNPSNGEGERFRIEAKSMVAAADEAKAHFDVLRNEIAPGDQLLVIAWRWNTHGRGGFWVSPYLFDTFLGSASEVAQYRDQLHLMRGGSFVTRDKCPDGCEPALCKHHGEPLNAAGKRERRSGPDDRRVSRTTSHSQNFGGLKRMLAARGAEARRQRDAALEGNPTARNFVDFMTRNFRDLADD